MKRTNIFKIEYANTPPVYVFTKNGWCGIASNLKLLEHKCGMISQISLWRFIREWLNDNKRT